MHKIVQILQTNARSVIYLQRRLKKFEYKKMEYRLQNYYAQPDFCRSTSTSLGYAVQLQQISDVRLLYFKHMWVKLAVHWLLEIKLIDIVKSRCV